MGTLLSLLAATAVIGGCIGVGSSGKAKSVAAGAPIAFIPQAPHASISLAKGTYPDLFSTASYAEWATPAEGENTGMIEVMCCIESSFADSSIAYDVVGLRGVQVYLYTLDGKRISPARTIMGQMLEAEPRGALKIFRRTNRLLFPSDAVRSPAAPPNAPPSTMRLVLEGYDSVFYFEWAGQNALPVRPVPFYKTKAARDAKKEAGKLRKRATEFGHTFD